MNKKSVFINNISAFLPNKPVSNNEMEDILGQVGIRPSRARRIILRTNGIKERYYAIDPETKEPNYTNAQLCAEAIKGLANDNFSTGDIETLVASTSIADQIMPNHAVMVHGELGNPPCEVTSTSGVCMAGMTGMKYAYLSILSGDKNCAVAAASEASSNLMHSGNFREESAEDLNDLEANQELTFDKDFLRWMLSDGAGAVLLEDTPNEDNLSLKIDWIEMRSYANEAEVCMYAGAEKVDGKLVSWTQIPASQRNKHSTLAVKQDVKLLNANIVYYTLERALPEILDQKELDLNDIDFFLPHFSSMYFHDKVYECLKALNCEIPLEKWFTNLAMKGNTGSASIYIMLDELFHSKKLKDGDKILCFIPESGRFSACYMLLTAISPKD